MADLSKFRAFIAQWLPEIAKNEMQIEQIRRQAEIWKQRTLEEYKAWGEQQTQTGDEQLRRELLKSIMNPEFFKARPLPELTMAKSMTELLPQDVTAGLGLRLPPDITTQLNTAVGAGAAAAGARQSLSDLPSDQAAVLVRSFGLKPTLDVIGDIQKQKEDAKTREAQANALGEEIKARELRAKELTESGKGRALGEKTLAQRTAEFNLKAAGGETADEQKKDLKALSKERDSLIETYYGVNKGFQARGVAKQVTQNAILDLTKKIIDIRGALNIPGEKKYATIAQELRARGITQETILNDPNLTRELLKQGYIPFKILEYY